MQAVYISFFLAVFVPFFPSTTANPQTGNFLENIFQGKSIILVIVIILCYVCLFWSNWLSKSLMIVYLFSWCIISDLSQFCNLKQAKLEPRDEHDRLENQVDQIEGVWFRQSELKTSLVRCGLKNKSKWQHLKKFQRLLPN